MEDKSVTKLLTAIYSKVIAIVSRVEEMAAKTFKEVNEEIRDILKFF